MTKVIVAKITMNVSEIDISFTSFIGD